MNPSHTLMRACLRWRVLKLGCLVVCCDRRGALLVCGPGAATEVLVWGSKWRPAGSASPMGPVARGRQAGIYGGKERGGEGGEGEAAPASIRTAHRMLHALRVLRLILPPRLPLKGQGQGPAP